MSEAEHTDEKPFKPGDVVQLKSGGAKMTVAWCDDQFGILSVYCHWHVTDKPPWKKESEVYPVTSVKLIEG